MKLYHSRGQGFIYLIKSGASGFTAVSLMKLWPVLEPYATFETFAALSVGTYLISLLMGWLDYTRVRFSQRETVAGLPFQPTSYEVLYSLRVLRKDVDELKRLSSKDPLASSSTPEPPPPATAESE